MKQLSLAALATIICAAMLHGDAEDTPSQLVVDTLYGDVPFVRFEPPEEHPIPPEYNHDIPQPQSIGVARSVRVPDQLRPPQQLPAPPAHRPQNSPTFHAWEIPGVRGAYFGISIVPTQSPRPEKILDVRSFAFQKFKKKDSDPLHGYSPQQFLNKLVHQWNSYGCLTGKPSFEHYAFTHFNYYQFGGFRELLPHLNGYRSFLEEVVTETDKNKKMRKKLDNITGMKKKLVHHFRDELKRVKREYHERRRYEEEQRKRQEQYEREVAEYKQKCQEVEREKQRIQQQYLQRHNEWLDAYTSQQEQENHEREQRTSAVKDDYAYEQKRHSQPYYQLFSTTTTRELLDELEEAFDAAEDDSDDQDFVVLGRHFLHEATEAFEHNCADECITALDRTHAILQTIEDEHAVHTQTHELSDHAKQYSTEFDIEYATFEQFTGNHLQQFINRDLARILNDAGDVRFAHENNFHVNNLSRMIFHCSDISLAHNIEAEYQAAFDFLDLSRAFCTMTQKLAYAFGKGIVTGAVSGVKDLATFACSLVMNPPDTIIDFMKSTWQVVTVLSKVVHRGITDPKGSAQRAKDLSAKLAAHVYEYPEESVEQTTSFITNFLTQGYLCAKAAPRIKKFTTHLSKVMQDETALLKGAKIVQPEAQKLIAPVSYLARETVDAVHTPLYTRTTVLEAIEEMPTIMLDKHVEKWAISNLDVINEYRQIVPLKSSIHIYWGEYQFPHQIVSTNQSVGLLKGMHTLEGLKYFKRHFGKTIPELLETKIIPCEAGMKIVQLPKKAFAKREFYKKSTTILNGQTLQGTKTLWPSEYSLRKITEDAVRIKTPANKIKNCLYEECDIKKLRISIRTDNAGTVIKTAYIKPRK